MTIEERISRYTSLLEHIHHSIEPLKQETMILEGKVGYDNYKLIDASDLVIRRQDALQNEYLAKVANCENDAEVEILLQEFEEEFYNAVLDYKNSLQNIEKGK